MDPETKHDKIDRQIKYLEATFQAWLGRIVSPAMIEEVVDELYWLSLTNNHR